jgi:hypothetical protein
MIATTGASAALAGLVLVFVGVLAGTYQQLLGRTGVDASLAKIKAAANGGVALFVLSLISIVLDLTWLIVGGGKDLYIAALVMFFAQLAVLGFIALNSTHVLLKG